MKCSPPPPFKAVAFAICSSAIPVYVMPIGFASLYYVGLPSAWRCSISITAH